MFMHSPGQQLPKGLPSSAHVVPDGFSPPALSTTFSIQSDKNYLFPDLFSFSLYSSARVV